MTIVDLSVCLSVVGLNESAWYKITAQVCSESDELCNEIEKDRRIKQPSLFKCLNLQYM